MPRHKCFRPGSIRGKLTRRLVEIGSDSYFWLVDGSGGGVRDDIVGYRSRTAISGRHAEDMHVPLGSD